MLVEIHKVFQVRGEPRKRWFNDDYFDLYTWHDETGRIVRFELCYSKEDDEHAIVWSGDGRVGHSRVDDGESQTGRYKMSPIFVPDGEIDVDMVAERFGAASGQMDPEIAGFVKKVLHAQSS